MRNKAEKQKHRKETLSLWRLSFGGCRSPFLFPTGIYRLSQRLQEIVLNNNNGLYIVMAAFSYQRLKMEKKDVKTIDSHEKKRKNGKFEFHATHSSFRNSRKINIISCLLSNANGNMVHIYRYALKHFVLK